MKVEIWSSRVAQVPKRTADTIEHCNAVTRVIRRTFGVSIR